MRTQKSVAPTRIAVNEEKKGSSKSERLFEIEFLMKMRRYLQYPDYVAFKIDGVTEKNGTINATKKLQSVDFDSKREQQQKNGAEHGM